MTESNTIELVAANNGYWMIRLDGRMQLGAINRRALAATVGRSDRFQIWPDKPEVIVDQVGNEVRWKVWNDGAWQVYWFLRDEYERQARISRVCHG